MEAATRDRQILMSPEMKPLSVLSCDNNKPATCTKYGGTVYGMVSNMGIIYVNYTYTENIHQK
jgi:hypothetical protein